MLSILDAKWILFVKVAELGSLTHAASVLDMPQSVISRQIAALERECGSHLFRRTGRGVVLTDFGQEIFPRVKALIAQADQLWDDIRTSSGEPLGDVRLGLLPSAVPLLAAKLYRAVMDCYPRVRLHLTEGSSVQLEDWLNQGRLDLSLLLREDERELPGEITLRRVSLSLIGPPEDSITTQPSVTFRQLAELPLVLPGEPHLLRARLNALAAQHQLKLTVRVEADSIRLQEEIVAAGGGYAIVAAVRPVSAARLSAALIVEPELSRRVVLSPTLLRPHTLAARAVTKLIQEIAPTCL
jgi:LysR family transcriptional regulator, nitrogen assimilation regulatory protein